MLGWLSSIKESIEGIAGSITEGVGNALRDIFVPSEDFLTEKVDYIKGRFGFVTFVVEFARDISDFFNTTFEGEPPTITVDLGLAESEYDYGGEATILDMTWYSRYKPLGDTILSGMMLLFFGWRYFTQLPSIIGGDAGFFAEGTPSMRPTATEGKDVGRIKSMRVHSTGTKATQSVGRAGRAGRAGRRG